MSPWFKEQLSIVNVGLASFAESARECGARVTQIEWQPPAEGDRDAGMALARLVGDARVEQANERAYAAYLNAQPALVGVGVARDEVPGLQGRRIAHAGPPIDWPRMCGPMQGAILGACLFEGWARDLEAAEALAGGGGIGFSPCHHHDAVGPMAGVISPSMPVWIVENASSGARCFSNMNEGLGKVLRFGANGPEVIERLRWMAQTLGPALAAALQGSGPIELKPLMAQALHMGDEVHNRNAAASGLLLKRLLPALVESGMPGDTIAKAVRFMAGNDHTFLNLSMAACKSMLDAAHGVAGSSMVTAMARNGVRFGIRLSGTGESWFEADAPQVDGLYFSGYGPGDAAGDLGDSAITETAGLGGFAMAAAPAIVQFVGGTPADAVAYTQSMRHITLGRNTAFTLPALSFAGTPAGIDARKVLDTGILPVINTGIAHKQAGIGQIGAGVTSAPLACFTQAVRALDAGLEARA
jgi:hypothetical protein